MVGIVNVVFTIPAILTIDKLGRRPLLLAGSALMLLAQVVAGAIVATSQDNWDAHRAAGWGAVVMIWIYIASFAFSWGPASWILIAEIFPLSIRAKGSSIGASSNWMKYVMSLDYVVSTVDKLPLLTHSQQLHRRIHCTSNDQQHFIWPLSFFRGLALGRRVVRIFFHT